MFPVVRLFLLQKKLTFIFQRKIVISESRQEDGKIRKAEKVDLAPESPAAMLKE